MALIACRECRAEISSDAKACPKCGAKRTRSWTWLWWIGGAAAVFILWAVSLPPMTYSQMAADDAARCIRREGGGEWRASSGMTLNTFCNTKATVEALNAACKANPSKC